MKSSFTNAEAEVIKLVGAGFSNKEISEKLSKSEKTVKSHLYNVFRKLGIKSRYQLILYVNRSRYRNRADRKVAKELILSFLRDLRT